VNSVCNQCYYRGHVINSTKTCPTSILLECLQRADSGRSWAHDTIKYCTAADHLRTVTNHLKDANDPRYERLENLIKDFDEIRGVILPSPCFWTLIYPCRVPFLNASQAQRIRSKFLIRCQETSFFTYVNTSNPFCIRCRIYQGP
jgi:hypothetical protein